jgi:4-hydroxy-2-oxoheptanedioate aldolase
MTFERVRGMLQSGQPVYAGWIGLGDTLSAESMGGQGYDALILDAQHGGITWDNMMRVLQATDLSGACGFVRVPACESAQIMRALDLGAKGVIIPMVSNAMQARQAAEAMRYPPQGMRSFGSVRNFYSAPGTSFEPLCFVMIETAEAMENLESIAATSGVDGLFVGPVDLALSLGLGLVLQMREEVLARIEEVVSVCRRHGKVSGSASLGLPYARGLLDRGVQFIAQGSDLGFVRRGAASELEAMRAWRQTP